MEATNRTSQAQVERIKSELRSAGISQIKQLRFPSRYLTRVIHADEHIKAALQGRRKDAPTLMGYTEAMIVATDKRVLFIEHRPGYTTMDEISYDVVSGVNVSMIGLFGSLTLFTKIADYTVTLVNFTLAQRFADFIEGRAIDKDQAPMHIGSSAVIGGELFTFLENHDIGVLSSITRTGAVSGAAVYYTLRDGRLYFITKTSSRKASNILGNQQVAMTIFDEARLQTAQIAGIVEMETDEAIKKEIIEKIVKPRRYTSGAHLPPVVQAGGDYIVFRVIPTDLSFSDYEKS